jgi:hypothetical protein
MLKRLIMLVFIIGVVAAFSPAANAWYFCPGEYYKNVGGQWHVCCPYTAYVSGQPVECEECYGFSWGTLNWDYFGKFQPRECPDCLTILIAAFGTYNKFGTAECENLFSEDCYTKVLRIQRPHGLKGKKWLDTPGQPGYSAGYKFTVETLEIGKECSKKNCRDSGTFEYTWSCPNPNWECYEIPIEFDGVGCSCRLGWYWDKNPLSGDPRYRCCTNWDDVNEKCADFGDAKLIAMRCEDKENLDPDEGGVYVIGDTGEYKCTAGEEYLGKVPDDLCEDLFNKAME